jgi:hypothetical protein
MVAVIAASSASERLIDGMTDYSASPQTEVAGGHSINDDQQRDEPEGRENILDHCRTRTGTLLVVYALGCDPP